MRPATRVLAAGILILSVLAVPGQAGILYGEDFEGETFGASGAGISNTYTGSGVSNNFVDQARANTGLQSLHITKKGSLTDTTTFCNTGRSIQFYFQVDTLPTSATDEFWIGVHDAGDGISGVNTLLPGQFVGLKVRSTGVVQAWVNTANAGGTGTHVINFAAAPTADVWHFGEISTMECTLANVATTGVSHRAYITYDGETVRPYSATGFTGGTASDATMKALSWGSASPTPTTVVTWLDDVNTGVTSTLGTDSLIFCSSPGSTNYGYDINDGVTQPDPAVLRFEAQDDDSDYVGKSWGGVSPTASGVHSVRVFFTIAAAIDVGSSKFRATFTNTPATGTVAAPTLSPGDQDHTADFANSVDVLFTETGNDWTAGIYYTTAGGSRTQIGPSFVGDEPNQLTQYVLEVNTNSSSGANYVALKYSNTTGVPGMNFTIPPAAGKTNAFWYEQWFIGESTSLVLDKRTDLLNTGLSTCIFTIGNTTAPVPNGDQGRLISSGLVTSTSTSTAGACASAFCVDEATVPEGFTVAAFNLFLGILMAAAIAAGFYSLGKSKIAMVVGVSIGLILAFTFGLMPLWPILVIVVVSVAFIFLSTRGVGS